MLFERRERLDNKSYFSLAGNMLFRPEMQGPSDLSGRQKMIQIGRLADLALPMGIVISIQLEI